jgi:hypothetical protein
MFIKMWLQFMLHKKSGAMIKILPFNLEMKGLNPCSCNLFYLSLS